jgi:hypothetical protein
MPDPVPDISISTDKEEYAIGDVVRTDVTLDWHDAGLPDPAGSGLWMHGVIEQSHPDDPDGFDIVERYGPYPFSGTYPGSPYETCFFAHPLNNWGESGWGNFRSRAEIIDYPSRVPIASVSTGFTVDQPT